MNRRNFLRMAASAAAGLVVPRVDPEPKYTDADVERIVEENEALESRLDASYHAQDLAFGILKDISGHLGDHGFPWAVYWRDLTDQVKSLCVERDELKGRIEMYEEIVQFWQKSVPVLNLLGQHSDCPFSVEIQYSRCASGPGWHKFCIPVGDAADLEDIPGITPSVDFRRLYPSSDDVEIHWGAHGYADTKGENDAEETDPV